jgi:hypothetical protein
MRDPLVAETILAAKDEQIRQRIRDSGQRHGNDVDHQRYGQALRRFLLFSQWPELLHGEVPDLDAETLLYNSYYWLKRFSKLYMAEHGYQAGFEQQAFQLLEHADVSFDWSIIERLEHEAGRPIEE